MTQEFGVRDSLLALIQGGPWAAKLTTGAGAAVLAALWQSLTSVLAAALAVFFLGDLLLGVLRAVHAGGVPAFDRVRFWRAWIKLAAALLGVMIFTTADLLLHEAGMSETWLPLTSAALVGMCWGFFWSGLQSFAYFWPDAAAGIESALRRMVPPKKVEERRRQEERTDP